MKVPVVGLLLTMPLLSFPQHVRVPAEVIAQAEPTLCTERAVKLPVVGLLLTTPLASLPQHVIVLAEVIAQAA